MKSQSSRMSETKNAVSDKIAIANTESDGELEQSEVENILRARERKVSSVLDKAAITNTERESDGELEHSEVENLLRAREQKVSSGAAPPVSDAHSNSLGKRRATGLYAGVSGSEGKATNSQEPKIEFRRESSRKKLKADIGEEKIARKRTRGRRKPAPGSGRGSSSSAADAWKAVRPKGYMNWHGRFASIELETPTNDSEEQHHAEGEAESGELSTAARWLKDDEDSDSTSATLCNSPA